MLDACIIIIIGVFELIGSTGQQSGVGKVGINKINVADGWIISSRKQPTFDGKASICNNSVFDRG
jgi:hypothetical protein